MGNLSTVTVFVFSGFPQLQTGGLLYFFPLPFIYIFIMAGNLMIFIVVRLNTHLHNPMYNLTSIFLFLEMWYSTAAIPKMLSNLISEHKTISFVGCLLQMYFFHSLGNTEGILLTIWLLTGMLLSATHSANLTSSHRGCARSVLLVLVYLASSSFYLRLCGFLLYPFVVPIQSIRSSVISPLC